MKFIEHLLNLFSTVAGCVSISGSASLVGIPVGFMSSSICTITAEIKKYKSITKKKKEPW